MSDRSIAIASSEHSYRNSSETLVIDMVTIKLKCNNITFASVELNSCLHQFNFAMHKLCLQQRRNSYNIEVVLREFFHYKWTDKFSLHSCFNKFAFILRFTRHEHIKNKCSCNLVITYIYIAVAYTVKCLSRKRQAPVRFTVLSSSKFSQSRTSIICDDKRYMS